LKEAEYGESKHAGSLSAMTRPLLIEGEKDKSVSIHFAEEMESKETETPSRTNKR